MPTYALKSDLTAEVNRAKAAEVKETNARVTAANALVAADQAEAATRGGADTFLRTSLDALGVRLDALTSRVTALEPAPTPPPVPTPPPPAAGAFLSYPASGVISLNGVSDKTVGPFSIADHPTQLAVTLVNCHRITVLVDVDNCLGGVYAMDCTDIVTEDCRGRDIGDNTIGSGHSNFVQYNRVTGGAIRRNKVYGGHTEDMISIFQSGGPDAAHPLVVEDNHLESPLTDTPDARAWSSGSGTGTMVEDGHHVVVQRNTYLNVGQGGLGFNGGDDVHYLDNVLYCAKRPGGNVGLYGLPTSSGSWEVRRNRSYWFNAGGTPNPCWKPDSLATIPADWDTDNHWQDASIVAADLKVTL